MPTPTYTRLRFGWGLFDYESGYGGTADVTLGTSAVEGVGTAVRRAQLVVSRVAPTGYSEDVAVMHFDFINYTGGNPDDSWTAGDFTTLEGHLTTWWAAVRPYVDADASTREFRWYRLGKGIAKPNPAVRVSSYVTAGSATGTMLPPQVAISITRKTALRKRWGRTYLPSIGAVASDAQGRVVTTTCDALAVAEHNLNVSASAADFIPVVYSPLAQRAYAVESVQVDNIFDVIRRRRFDSVTYRAKRP